MKRTKDKYIQREISDFLYERLWEVYDKGYDLGEKADYQKIEIIKKEYGTLFRMSQKEPKKVMTVRDDVDYEFEGAVEVFHDELPGTEPSEHMGMFGKSNWI